MECSWQPILVTFICLVLGTEASYSNIDSCKKIDPTKRVECGWPGIRRRHCEAKGCCYDSRYPSLWCFQKEEQTDDADLTEVETQGAVLRTCSVNPNDRVDCGWPSIKKDVCENRGCCYSEQVRNSYWCFQPKTVFSQPIVQYIMECVSKCAGLSWRKTVAIGSTCKTNRFCWQKQHGMIGSLCMILCKLNSAVKNYIGNVSSCLGLSNVIQRKTLKMCDFDISCWGKKHGKEVRRCFAKYSEFVGGESTSKIEDLGQIARQPNPIIQMPLIPLDIPIEPNSSSDVDLLLYRDPNEQQTDIDVQKSVKSVTDLTEDEDTEPWWPKA